MAVEVVGGAAQHLADIRVASCAEQVVATGVVCVAAVADGVRDERDHRPQERKVAPQAVADGDVRTVELPGTARPEPLPRIVQRPQVEIDDLRTVDSGEPHDLPSRHCEGVARSDRHHGVAQQTTAILFGRQPLEQDPVRAERAVDGGNV